MGLVAATEPFGAVELERVRLIQFLVRHGIAAERIAAACRGELATSFAMYLGSLFPSGDADASEPPEGAARAGVSLEVVERFAQAGGLSHAADYLTPEDIEMLRLWPAGPDAGMPEEATLQLLRVFRDALARVAEAEIRLFHFYVHEALAASGLSGHALFEAADARASRL